MDWHYLRDSCVAGSRMDFRNVGVGQQGPDNGMFAAAGANNENLHKSSDYWLGCTP